MILGSKFVVFRSLCMLATRVSGAGLGGANARTGRTGWTTSDCEAIPGAAFGVETYPSPDFSAARSLLRLKSSQSILIWRSLLGRNSPCPVVRQVAKWR